MPVEATRRPEIHILDARRVAQPRELEQPREPAVVPHRLFALEQERQALLEGERREIG